MTDNHLIVLQPCLATAQCQSWAGISQPAVTLNEILYSSISLLIQPGISLAVELCGIWSRWVALLQMLSDIPFYLSVTGSQSHPERVSEKGRLRVTHISATLVANVILATNGAFPVNI